jgi:uncharacterized protein YkwD
MGTKSRLFVRTLVFIGCIVLMSTVAAVRSQELTVRSGSRTITFRSAKSDIGPHAMTPDDFAREMLNAHNDIRIGVGLPPLQWSGDLAVYSKKWASSLIAGNRTVHNRNSPYGENILATGLGSVPATVVTEWASESRNYTYITNTCKGDCGHYTQLVWRHTRKVGCAMAKDDSREIWVCSYDPAGNYRGEWPY